MWKIVSRLVLAAFLAAILCVPSAYAAERAETNFSLAAEGEMGAEVVAEEEAEETPAAEAKSGKNEQQDKKEKKEKKSKKQKQPKARYVQILTDDNFTYYLDTESMHYIPVPHSGTEKILDVWVRLVDNDQNGDANKPYSYPQKYYLEHYYIRPGQRQVQFLCELEVTGRPENTIQERAYSAKNWENLVPGSIEDDLYRSIMGHIKQEKKGVKGILPEGMGVRDALEEYLRISL